jgi:hypothetical protein
MQVLSVYRKTKYLLLLFARYSSESTSEQKAFVTRIKQRISVAFFFFMNMNENDVHIELIDRTKKATSFVKFDDEKIHMCSAA